MATVKDKKKNKKIKDTSADIKDNKTPKCKRGKKIWTQWAEKGLGKNYLQFS